MSNCSADSNHSAHKANVWLTSEEIKRRLEVRAMYLPRAKGKNSRLKHGRSSHRKFYDRYNRMIQARVDFKKFMKKLRDIKDVRSRVMESIYK